MGSNYYGRENEKISPFFVIHLAKFTNLVPEKESVWAEFERGSSMPWSSALDRLATTKPLLAAFLSFDKCILRSHNLKIVCLSIREESQL